MDWQQRLNRLQVRALASLIRTVGQGWAEDEDLLDDYVAEQVEMWSDTPARLQQAIECFEQLKEQVCGKSMEQAR